MIPNFICKAAESIELPILVNIDKKIPNVKNEFFLLYKAIKIESLTFLQKVHFECQLKFNKNHTNKEISTVFIDKIFNKFVDLLKNEGIYNISIDGYSLSITAECVI